MTRFPSSWTGDRGALRVAPVAGDAFAVWRLLDGLVHAVRFSAVSPATTPPAFLSGPERDSWSPQVVVAPSGFGHGDMGYHCGCGPSTTRVPERRQCRRPRHQARYQGRRAT